MAAPRNHDQDGDVEALAEQVREDNPDPTTRREAFELELMDEGRSEEGRDVEVVDDEERAETS
jgi:hypothetical protein